MPEGSHKLAPKACCFIVYCLNYGSHRLPERMQAIRVEAFDKPLLTPG